MILQRYRKTQIDNEVRKRMSASNAPESSQRIKNFLIQQAWQERKPFRDDFTINSFEVREDKDGRCWLFNKEERTRKAAAYFVQRRITDATLGEPEPEPSGTDGIATS